MGIPKPLVQLNQLFIVITVTAGLIFSHWILLLPFLNGVITLLRKRNPLIEVTRPFLRKPLFSYIQEDRQQQLFNQWIATICLGLALISSLLNAGLLTLFFGIAVAAAALLALFGFCIGCTIRYRYLMWKNQ
ncbi:DUF4395 domain-containing protein [Alkalihalobacillus oceani]|uniref:DUF4395 domain-containing protein n=1 Tax=Halalkalibacter oceani TaxID=1653776 RepID=A0A9X2INQ4_9BACI|nr:DUF4395 family protein [Halalkalibacter oceani]MCM3712823.1 DUF4395 domain-containing protein [Halalkalibacter oceani]